jgi:hypothetical protein
LVVDVDRMGKKVVINILLDHPMYPPGILWNTICPSYLSTSLLKDMMKALRMKQVIHPWEAL